MQPPFNNPPVLSGIDDFFPTFDVNDIKSGVFKFGPISDPDAGETVSMECFYIPDSGVNYFSIDSITAELRVIDMVGLLSSKKKYQIKIFLLDSNIVIPGSSTYIITFDLSS